MGAIRLLSEGLVNRIAAGEVVERPAAAVKELVENALDAGATRIAVQLERGGIDRIEVVDDGAGMDAADLVLAVQRHCTSKLADEALVRITTLGFRGEALPSIGAAARLRLCSRPHAAAHAHAIRVEGGVVSAVVPQAGAPGTTATVTDLFYATPARRQFLKQPRTEADHAEAAIRRLALAAPGVAFRMESDGRTLFDLPAQDRFARVAALLGPGGGGGAGAGSGAGSGAGGLDASLLLGFEEARGEMALAGFAGVPTATRASGAGQSIVVNGRPVTDRALTTALRVAYRDVIVPGRHPIAALYLALPPDQVDVNVHPAKTELRFRDPEAVRGLVVGALRRALAGGARPVSVGGRPGLRLVAGRPTAAAGRSFGFAEAMLPLTGGPAARVLAAPERVSAAPAERSVADHPLGAALGQIFDTYVLAVAGDGSLVLVDQHAAHERLTHEALRQQLAAGGVRRQPLLLPAVVDLPPAACARLLDAAAALERLGLELEGFGVGAILVRALPAVLGAPDPAPLLRDLADTLADGQDTAALDQRLDAALARLACHGSIRAGRRLQPAEMDALLRQMEQTPRAATCSHGRPTVLRLSRGEIEALFGRR